MRTHTLVSEDVEDGFNRWGNRHVMSPLFAAQKCIDCEIDFSAWNINCVVGMMLVGLA